MILSFLVGIKSPSFPLGLPFSFQFHPKNDQTNFKLALSFMHPFEAGDNVVVVWVVVVWYIIDRLTTSMLSANPAHF